MNLNRAARQVAADLLRRPAGTGRMNKEERTLAALKVVEITNSSVHIALSPPEPASGIQLELTNRESKPVDPLDVVAALQSDLAGEKSKVGMSTERRSAIDAVLRSSQRLGSSLRMSSQSQVKAGRTFLEVDLSASKGSNPDEASQGITYGVAHMVDIEPGNSRLRVRTYEGESLLIHAPSRFVKELPGVLGKPIEARFEETSRAAADHKRTLKSVRLLEQEEIGEIPVPRRWRQLAAQHGISLSCVPNHPELIRGHFESEEEIDDFIEFLESMR